MHLAAALGQIYSGKEAKEMADEDKDYDDTTAQEQGNAGEDTADTGSASEGADK
jgi:hypothetical protein